MAQIYRFYLVLDDGAVEGTDDLDVATGCKQDGSTVVIEPLAMEYTFDNDVQAISVADRDDYLDPDDEGDDE